MNRARVKGQPLRFNTKSILQQIRHGFRDVATCIYVRIILQAQSIVATQLKHEICYVLRCFVANEHYC